ncbi:hypothetical protein D3C76_278810 [compost metagenome]
MGHTDAGDALLHVGVQVGAFVGYGLPCAPLPGFDQQHDAEENRQSGKNDEGEPYIDSEHERGDKD